MTDSIRPLILTASPAFKPFATIPPTLSYVDLGLPDDWEPRWDGDRIESFSHLLAKMAEEAWARTEEPIHDAATAPVEMAVAKLPGAHDAFLQLEGEWTAELFAMAGQAALVGWALGQTMHYASDLELWLQQAMELVGLRMMTPEARRAAKDATFTAYEDDFRRMGRPVPERPANWADVPTIAAGNDGTEDTSS